MSRAALVTIALALLGCYAPHVADGVYSCPDGVCPKGMVCSQCRVCIQSSEPTGMCASCSRVAPCALGCMVTDFSCQNTCAAVGTETAQKLLQNLRNCQQSLCQARCNNPSSVDCKTCNADAIKSDCPLDPLACGKCTAQYQACEADTSGQ
jgi:hypothetical protein